MEELYESDNDNQTGEGNGSNAGTGNGDGSGNDSFSKVSAGISSGGSRPTIINVTLGQFQEKMEVIINQGEFAEKVGMIEEQFQEMFLRVLNSSAQVANQ